MEPSVIYSKDKIGSPHLLPRLKVFQSGFALLFATFFPHDERDKGMNKLVLGFQSISLAFDGSLRPFYEETETRIAAKTSSVPWFCRNHAI